VFSINEESELEASKDVEAALVSEACADEVFSIDEYSRLDDRDGEAAAELVKELVEEQKLIVTSSVTGVPLGGV
jgi:hypothetical protein